MARNYSRHPENNGKTPVEILAEAFQKGSTGIISPERRRRFRTLCYVFKERLLNRQMLLRRRW